MKIGLQLAVCGSDATEPIRDSSISWRYGHGSPKLGPGLSVWSNSVGSLMPLCVACCLLSSRTNKYKDQKTVVFWTLMNMEYASTKISFFGYTPFSDFSAKYQIVDHTPKSHWIPYWYPHCPLGYDWYHILYPNPINIHIIDPLIPFIWSRWFHQYSHEIDSTCSSDRQI